MNQIKFLGTAGARFVVINQTRKSGGVWINLDDTNILIDPGPGSLIRCLNSKPKLNPEKLNGIVLTHRHIDHSNDINIIIEAMTKGGFNKKGIVFVPKDGIDEDPVILEYYQNYLEKIVIIQEKKVYNIGNIKIEFPIKHIHGVETYGLNIKGKKFKISIISDTKYFDGIEKYYDGEILILNVVLTNKRENIFHLSIEDAEKIIKKNRPKLSIITHFGMTIIKNKPWIIAEALSKKTNSNVIAASDGLSLDLNEF
jgi:phosphoribosyl 1,2-cyclic phosphodiesterase